MRIDLDIPFVICLVLIHMALFEELKQLGLPPERALIDTLSMGMSGDYEVAVEEGSTIVRVGSSIFGARNYR